MSTSLTLIISYIARSCLMSSHAEPLQFDSPFLYREGTFPRVSLSYTCVLALSIGMFHCLELVCLPLETRLLLVFNYKALLFFFNLFKIFEKVQKKNKKTKKLDRKRCYLWQQLSHVAFEHSTIYHIRWLGNSFTLGAIIIFLVYLHRLDKLPIPMEPLSMPPMP